MKLKELEIMVKFNSSSLWNLNMAKNLRRMGDLQWTIVQGEKEYHGAYYGGPEGPCQFHCHFNSWQNSFPILTFLIFPISRFPLSNFNNSNFEISEHSTLTDTLSQHVKYRKIVLEDTVLSNNIRLWLCIVDIYMKQRCAAQFVPFSLCKICIVKYGRYWACTASLFTVQNWAYYYVENL